MIDVSQVNAFADRLERAAANIDERSDIWEEKWGAAVAGEMVATVPRLSGELAESIRQVAPGVIEVGAKHGIFVDRGTSRMAPQPFASPAVNRIRPQAVDDARHVATGLIDK